jgi:hypothetical protein
MTELSNTPICTIGTPGFSWGDAEKAQWLGLQRKKRCYRDEVISPLALAFARDAALVEVAELLEYGVLDYQPLALGRYPLLAVRSRVWQADKPTVLVTGGVHGYETSGVQGALLFIIQQFRVYTASANLLVLPCLSPWAYETINRWNPLAIDLNRSFYQDSPSAEAAMMQYFIRSQAGKILLHIDLHETTDTDNSEFGPAKAARDGQAYVASEIPDGFYLVGDSEKPAADFQRALIAAVSQVTHIAVADEHGCIIGEPLQQLGVIHYAKKALGLCGGISDAPYVTTTEVYPDSPKASAAQCNLAQMTAICAAIDYVLAVSA